MVKKYIFEHASNESKTSSKSGGSKGVAVVELSKSDQANQKKVHDGLREIKEVLKKQTKDTSSSALMRMLEKVIKASGQSSKISSAELKTLATAFANELSRKGFGGSGSATVSGPQGKALDPNIIAKAISNQIAPALKSVFKSLETKDIKIDPKSQEALRKAMESSVSDIIPSKFYKVINDLNSTLTSVLALSKTSLKAFNSAKGMASDKGGLEVKEITGFYTNLKKGSSELKTLVGHISSLVREADKLPAELRAAAKGMIDAAREAKDKTVRGARAVREGAQVPQAKLVKEVTKLLASEIKKHTTGSTNPAVNNLIKALDTFSSSADELTKLTKALDNFGKSIGSLQSDGGVDLKGLQGVLGKLEKTISAIPTEIKGGAVKSDEWKDFIDQANKVINTVKTLVVKIQLPKDEIDRFVKQLPGEFDVVANIDISNVPKAIKEITKPVGIPVKTIFSADDIQRRLRYEHPEISVTQRITTVHKQVEEYQSSKSGKAVKEVSLPNAKSEAVKFSKDLNTSVNNLIKVLEGLSKVHATAYGKPVAQGSAGDIASDRISELIHKIQDKRGNTSQLREYVDKTQGHAHKTGILSQAARDGIKEVYEILHSTTDDVFNSVKKSSDQATKNLESVSKAFDAVNKSSKQMADTAKNNLAQTQPSTIPSSRHGATSVNTARQAPASTQKEVYKYFEGNITPGKTANIDAGKKLNLGEDSRKIVQEHVSGLANSLLDLQSYMVSTLEKEFAKVRKESNSGKDWRIVGKTDTGSISDYFKLTEGYNQKTSGNEYSFKIADVKNLKRVTGSKTNDPTALISKFKEGVFKELLAKNEATIAESIGRWMKRFSESDISSWKGLDSSTARQLADIKSTHDKGQGTAPSKRMVEAIKGLGATDPSALNRIFEKTISDIEATRRLGERKYGSSVLVKKIAIPAAKLSATGAATIDTATGSKRIIPKFATYKTGFEKVFESLQKTKTFDVEQDYQGKVRKLGIRPSGTQFEEANKVAKAMLIDLSRVKDIVNATGQTTVDSGAVRADLAKQLETSVVLKAGKLEKSKHVTSASDVLAKIDKSIYAEFASGTKTMEEFIAATSKAGVSAYDLVKGMESIDFQNIYQIFQKILEGTDSVSSPLKAVGKNPDFSKSVRDLESYIGKMVGTIPIADPSRPRRASHQEKVINLMSMTSPIYSQKGKVGTQGLTAEGQKQFLRDLNLSLREFVRDTAILKDAGMGQGRLPADVRTLSSLGVPESQAGTISEYRKDGRNENTKYLAALNATTVKMYSDSLSEMAPFGAQFQQLGRNISNTTNAMAYRPGGGGVGTDFPSLRSERETKLISGGRYGDKGYGFNVIAELRNTASTFEDQIVISGKLADVLTSVTKTIVQPDKLGRLNLVGSDGQVSSSQEGRVGDIKPDQQLIGAIETANKVFQDVLGVKQEYRGRADNALIKEVTSALTTVRGKDVQVQSAKIAETFFNHYGRKFTTRYGSKGVSITAPGGTGELTGKQLKDLYADKKVKVLSKSERATAGLGTVALPKSMGQLVQEIYKEYAKELGLSNADLDESRKALINSGNKFMLSMFTDSSLGVVPEGKDVKAQQTLFTKTKKALAKLDFDLAKDISGIEGLIEVYKGMDGSKLYEEKPIDIRISSHGIAKRGLQAENLEAIMNNVIDAGVAGSTSLKTKFDPSTYKRLLGTEEDTTGKFPSLSEISKALGFESQGNPKKRGLLVKDMMKLLKSRNVPGTEDKLLAQAGKLADLEIGSSFYSDMRDEFGKSRKSLIGPKFVEVIEDPNANPAWSETDIKKQVAGQKINIPAFGAYATVFGEQSQFIKQMTSSIPLDSKKHWEYLKALQVLNDDSSEMATQLLSSAQEVDVSSLRTFTKSTGKFVSRASMSNITEMPEEDQERVLNDTILDIAKFPGAMNLKIPSTKDPSKRESFYVPGALARTTYPEPSLAGERGLDMTARRLQAVVNAAKNVDEVAGQSDESGSKKLWNTVGRIKKRLAGYRGRVKGIVGESPGTKQLTSGEVGELEGILSTLLVTLDQSSADERMLYKNQQHLKGGTRGDVIRAFKDNKSGEGKSQAQVYQTTIDQAVDQLIGPQGSPDPKNPQWASRYDKQANVLGGKAYNAGLASVEQFAKSLNVQPSDSEDDLKKALQSLERAKIEYYNTLATSALGKTGSVQEFLFNRKMPAVMGKAINATVDKTEDLDNFSKELLSISSSAGGIGVDLSALEEASENIKKIKIEHAENVESARSKGMPVLTQHQVGIPESYASKLPTNFARRYEVDGGTVQELKKPIFEKSNLAKMLDYREEIQGALDNVAPGMRSKMEAYLESELSPYLESMRFPVTGVASIQPYEAKLLKQGEGRQMTKHTLMAPGMPEIDMGKFDAAKKQVDSVIDELTEQRKLEYKEESPDLERINQLTATIAALDKAISDVIPKFIAVQQNLDFDGDQIQLHAAKTALARQEISQHFKTITDYDKQGGTTAQALRDQSTYKALIPSTEKYTLAEQQIAFSKKFPEKEGFGFMTKPFLTEGLDYLKPQEQLDILSTFPGAGGTENTPLTVLNNLLPELFRNEKHMAKIAMTLQAVKPEAGKDTASSQALLNALAKMKPVEDQPSSGREKAVFEEGIKTKLYDTKMTNAINANFFKLNTGQDTEALNRQLKLFERNLGYGGGVIRQGAQYEPTANLASRFPLDLKSMGNTMGEELHTMMNEFLRVGVQKGLDVKHAGETPIATEMANLISKGSPGVSSLIEKINAGEGSYGDLTDFAEANKKSLGRRLGGMSTEDLYLDAASIAGGRGESTTKLDPGNREELKEYITKSIGFEGFLHELSNQVIEAAHEGLMKSVSAWSDTKKQKEFKGSSAEDYVKASIRKQLKGDGINILDSAESPLMPLYKMRTSGASGYQQRGLYQDKYGDVEAPELEGIFQGKEADAYAAKYKEAKAVAKNIQDALIDFSSNKGGNKKGSYSMLLESSIENIYADQKEIMKLVQEMTLEKDRTSSSVMDRLSGDAPMHGFAREALGKKNSKTQKEFLEKYSRIVGVPSLGQESTALLKQEYLPQAAFLANAEKGPAPLQGETTDGAYQDILDAHDKAVDKLKEQYLADAIVIAQTDNILKAAKTKTGEATFLTQLLPTSKGDYASKSYDDRRQRISQIAKEKVQRANFEQLTHPRGLERDAFGRSMPSGGGPGGPGALSVGGTGPIVDVNIASVAEGVGVFLGRAAGMAKTTEDTSPRFTISEELEKKLVRAEEIVDEITGGLNKATGDSFANKYRASGLKGGQGLDQINEIKKQMQGIKAGRKARDILDSSSLLGTGIHAKLEDSYKKEYITERPVRYDSVAGEISGTVDAIKYDDNEIATHIVDIKTTSQKNYDDLKQAVARFQEKTGKETPTLDEIKDYVGKNLKDSKLGDVASQLNLYLAATSEDAKASAHFYSRTNPDQEPIKLDQFFDKERLDNDVAAVGQARREIKLEGGSFAKTASYTEAEEIEVLLKKKEVAEATIAELIATSTEYYTLVTKQGLRARKNLPSTGGLSDKSLNMIGTRAREFQAQSVKFDDMVTANPIAEGRETYKVHQNLNVLHERAKYFQQKEGYETSGPRFDKMHPQIQERVTEHGEKGPGGAAFSALVTELKDTGKIEGGEINAAWKAYRLAVGDYFVKKMAAARKELDNTDPGADNIVNVFGAYQKSVQAFQDFAKHGLGKPTDIYTYNKQYLHAESARGAGIYMDSAALQKKASQPLGEDPTLRNIFQNMTNLEGDSVPIPRDSVRAALEDLMDMDRSLINLYTNAEKVAHMGKDINLGWNFDKVKGGLSRLRAALDLQLKQPVGELYNEDQITYLRTVLKELKGLETIYISLDLDTDSFKNPTGEYKFPTLVPVPKQLSRDQQSAMHYQNIEKIKGHYRTPEAEGGAREGDSFVYNAKTFGPSGKQMDNQRFVISKYGEAINSAGKSVPILKSRLDNLNKSLVDGNRTFSVAIERVVKWGAAATLVYGGLSYIKDAVKHMSDVETAMARLQMVMNPLTTDFDSLQKAALGFAKQYGVETTDVLGSMKVFAQQGLSQGEVEERTQTSTLAANVTTLSAVDATEALTAAMKVFRAEGESSMRFLDSWSQVEARAAITAGDLADAIKKSASAGRNAGFTFDELNGMVAAIGSTTRQTGKEVGTSLRFIFRRISADKGPKALKGVGVATTTPKGTLRPGYKVLEDLAGKWEELEQAQKLSIAQAIGGTRQYNQVLVLMDNWDQVVKSTTDSMNAKGSAERRNLKLMKTYSKQLEQTKAVFSALKVEVGKVVLPSFKAGLTGIRGLVEAVNNVPASFKLAGAGMVLFVGYITKGAEALNTIMSLVDRTKLSFSALKDDFSKGIDKGMFEVFGKGTPELDSDLFGLSKLSDTGTVNIDDMESSLGKLAFGALSAGQAFNKFAGIVGSDSASAVSAVGKYVTAFGALVEKTGTGISLIPGIPGPVDEAVGVATSFTGKAIKGTGGAFDFVGDKVGKGAQSWMEGFASQNTSAMKSMAPLLGTLGGIALLAPTIIDAFKNLTQSATDYKDEQLNRLEVDAKEIDSLQGLITSYKNLQDQKEKITRLSDPKVQAKGIKRGEYKSPILEKIDALKATRTFDSNLGAMDPSMIAGFDEFGRVILSNTANLTGYLEELKRAKTVTLALSKLKIAARFTDDLTETGGNQEWKQQVKSLAAEFPLIGEMLAKNITVGPKKALEVIREELDQLLAAKAEAPMSTAFDSDIERSLTAHAKVLKTFSATYAELGKTLSSISTEGATVTDIADLYKSPDALKTFDLQAAYEDKYQIAEVRGTVSGRDIAASKVLRTQSSGLGSYIEASSVLTEANLFSAGRLPRKPKKDGTIGASDNDLVTLNKNFAEKYGIATGQATLKIGKDHKLFLEFIDALTTTPTTKEFSQAEIEAAARAFFPVDEILQKAQISVTKLNTFVAGASAGILGVSEKKLNTRQFDLGERFYDQIPTNVLLQTEKGYNTKTGTFGKQDYKEDYSSDFIDKYYDPLQKYNTAKSALGGDNASLDASVLGGLAEQLRGLQDILKNNSIAFQYRAAIEDLNKALYEGARATRKSILVEQERQKVDKHTAGFMRGKTKGVASIDQGVTNYKDLNDQQRASLMFKDYDALAKKILVQETSIEGLIGQSKSVASTYADIQEIGKAPEGFDAIMTRGRNVELMSIMDKVDNDKGAAQISMRVSELKSPLEGILANTDIMAANTYGRPGDIKRAAATAEENLVIAEQRKLAGKGPLDNTVDNKTDPVKTFKSLQKLMTIRDAAAKEGDTVTVRALDNTLADSYGRALKVYGMKDFARLTKLVAPTKFFSSNNKELVASRASALAQKGIGTTPDRMMQSIESAKMAKAALRTQSFIDKLTAFKAPEKEIERAKNRQWYVPSKEVRDYEKAYATDPSKPLINPKIFEKALIAGAILPAFQGKSLGEKRTTIEDQINRLQKQKDNYPKEGKEAEKLGIDKKIEGYQKILTDDLDPQQFVTSTLQGLSTTALAAYEGVGIFGGSQSDKENMAAVGAGLFVIMKSLESRIGKDNMPQYFKDFSKEAVDKIKIAVETGDYSDMANDLGKKTKKFLKGFNKSMEAQTEKAEDAGIDPEKDIRERRKRLKKLNATLDLESTTKSLNEVTDVGSNNLLRGLEAIAVVMTAQAVGGWKSKKGETAARVKDGVNVAKQQGLASLAYSEKNAAAVDAYIGKLVLTQKELAEKKGPDGGAINIVMDVMEDFKTSLTLAAAEGKTLEEAMSGLQDKIGDTKVFTGIYTDVAKLIGAMENFRAELQKSFTTFDDKRLLDPTRSLKGELLGFGGETTLPIGRRDMSTQQRAYAGGSDSLRSSFAVMSKGILIQEAQIKTLGFVRSQIADTEQNIDFGTKYGTSDSQLEAWEMHLKGLEGTLANLQNVTTLTSQQLQALGTSMRGAIKYSEAINKLNDALADVSVEHAVTGITGLKTYFDSFEVLLGGSDPLAAQPVSPEQERMGAKVGVRLVSGESTSMDIERAQLLTEIKNATDSKSRTAASIKLGDLDEKYRRLGIDKEQQVENQRLGSTMKPYEDFYRNMEGLLGSNELNDKQYGEISGVKNEFKEAMKRATEKIPIDEAIAQLEGQKDNLGANQFKEAMKELVAMKATGTTQVYRGMDRTKDWQGIMSRVMAGYDKEIDAYKAATGTTDLDTSLENMVTNPLVNVIGMSNLLLAELVTHFVDKKTAADILNGPQKKELEPDYLFSSIVPDKKVVLAEAQDFLKGISINPADNLKTQPYDFNNDNIDPNRGRPTLFGRPVGPISKDALGLPPIQDKVVPPPPTEVELAAKKHPRFKEMETYVKNISLDPIANLKTEPFGPNSEQDNSQIVAVNELQLVTLKKIATSLSSNGSGDSTEPTTKAAGGRIFGEGGPREDKVPAYLSPGEFVIRAAAAQRLGYENLDVMNKKGQVPVAFESGGSLNQRHITQAHQYFVDPDAVLPPEFNPESELYNKGITGKYIDLRKSMLSEEQREAVAGISTLKGLYNTFSDMAGNDEDKLNSLFPEDIMPVMERFEENKKAQEEKGILGWMKGKLKTKNKATAGARAVTGLDKAELLKEISTYADGGRTISTVTGKPIPTAEETEEGMAKMREALGFVASVGHPITSIPTSIYGMYQGFKEKGLSAQPAVEGFGGLELLNYIPQAKRLGKMKTILSKGFGRYFDNAGDVNDYFDITGKLGGKLTSSHGDDFDALLASENTFEEGGLSLWDKLLGKQFDPTERWKGKKLPSGMGKFDKPEVTKKLEDEIKATKRHDVHSFSFLREKHGFVKALQLYGAGSRLQEGADILKKADGGKIRSFIGDSTGVAEVGEELFNERINAPVLTRSVASMIKSEFGTSDVGNNQLGAPVDKLMGTSFDPSATMLKDSRAFTAVGNNIKSYASTADFNTGRAKSDKLKGNIGKGNIIPGMDGLTSIYDGFLTSKYNSPFLSQEEQSNNRAWYEATREQEITNKQKYELLGDAKTDADRKQLTDYWQSVGKAAPSKFADGGNVDEEEPVIEWGHTTAKAVMDKWTAEAKDAAMYRSLHAMSSAEDFALKLDRNKKARTDMTRILADNEYLDKDTQEGYDYSFDKHRGLRILTDEDSGVKVGRVITKSYRSVDESYRPRSMATVKKQVHDPFAISEDAYSSGALTDFSERLSLDSNYGNEAFRYHGEGRDIWKNMQRYKKLFYGSPGESKASEGYLAKFQAGQKNLDKVRLVMKVLEEGGNIYDDSRLQQKVGGPARLEAFDFGGKKGTVDIPTRNFKRAELLKELQALYGDESQGAIISAERIKNEISALNAQKIETSDGTVEYIRADEQKYTSVLQDIKDAAVIARGELDPKGKNARRRAVTRAQSPLLYNYSNTLRDKELARAGFLKQTGPPKDFSDFDKKDIPDMKKWLAAGDYGYVTSDTVQRMKDFITSETYNVGGVATRSMPVKHFGGVVTQTGPVFAQKGEYIIPKGFKDGTSGLGGVTSSPASQALTSGSMRLDGSEVLSQLNSLSLKVDNTTVKVDTTEAASRLSSSISDAFSGIEPFKVEDKTLLVEDKVFSVEDKKLTVEDKTFTIEDKTFKVEDKIFSVEDKKLTVEDKVFTIEDKVFKVEDKVLTIDASNISVDIGDAEARLASAISNAISSAVVNIKVEAPTTGGSVGADKFDQLAQTVSDVNDKLISSSVIMESRVKILEGGIDLVVDESVEKKLASKLMSINESVTGALLSVDTVANNVTTQIDSIRRESNEIKYLAHMALNARGSGNIT